VVLHSIVHWGHLYISIIRYNSVEVIGYIGRALSHFHDDELGPFIIQSLLLLVAPALFSGSIYMVLGRLIRFLEAEKYSLIRINWLTKLFVCGDIVAFVIQGTGTSILPSDARRGNPRRW
jgi:hypothetical protein